MSSAYLQSKTAPIDMETPATWQGMLDGFAQYVAILGLDATAGLNFGSSTPQPADRNKGWFKTTSGGIPLGLFSWNGTDWQQTPLTPLGGASSGRPVSPANNSLYFDTDLKCMLIFERAVWRTLDGVPNDVKFCRAATLADAIKANPGWVECTDARGRVLGAAGDGASLTSRAYNDQVGEESHVLTADELPAHTHGISNLVQDRMSRHDLEIIAWAGADAPSVGESSTSKTTDATGKDKGHNVMQPTLFLWCLQKQ